MDLSRSCAVPLRSSSEVSLWHNERMFRPESRSLCAAGLLLALSIASAQTDRHPFSADDWAALRSASVVAVSPDGATILSKTSWGSEKGTGNREWRLIATDGTNPRKLDLPEHFAPAGFTKDGSSLYGSYEVNNLPQFATFQLAGIKKASAPALLVALPNGIHSALLSPDGSRFAILANPSPPDDFGDVHKVVEPELASLYVVSADGTGGRWWCPDLKNIADSPGAGNPVGGGVMAWAPGGAAVALVSATPKIGYHYVRSFLDVCTAEGSRRVAEIP